MQQTKLPLKPVSPEDFDVQALRRLAREGRLYYDPNEPLIEDKRAALLDELCRYVSVIHECASPIYAPSIAHIWQAIAADERLSHSLLHVKGKKTGRLNRYRVLAIVTVMWENNIYDRNRFTLLHLHNLLEHTNRKTSVYTSRLNYALSYNDCRLIMQLCEKKLG